MKRLTMLLFGLLVVSANSVNAQEEKWFDLEKCAICKCMAGHEKIMEGTKMSVHKVKNGMLMVHTMPKRFKKEMEEVNKEMLKQIAKLQNGEQLPLCGFCMGYGGLKMSGASFEELETVAGPATLVTSDDEELVKKIHQFADDTEKHHSKMRKEMAAKKKKGGKKKEPKAAKESVDEVKK